MMIFNSEIPNLRLLTHPSEHRGEDWYEVSMLLDETLEAAGMELAGEEVYVLIGPQKDEFLIARPVIGPRKSFEAPFSLVDMTATRVFRKKIENGTWEELFKEVLSIMNGRKILICIRRRLNPDLKLEVEAIYLE